MAVWFDLAQVIGRDASQLEAEAAFAWVSHELATIDRELATLALKYGVPNPAALEESIRQNIMFLLPPSSRKLTGLPVQE